MSQPDECPKCHGMMEDDGTCSCGYGRKVRSIKTAVSRQSDKQKGPELCAWTDMGLRCVCRGILSSGLRGEGPWYCREHWDRLQGLPPREMGNATPKQEMSLGAKNWHAKMAAYKAAGGTSILDRKGNMAMPVTRERTEAGEDWEEDVVPAEADQA